VLNSAAATENHNHCESYQMTVVVVELTPSVKHWWPSVNSDVTSQALETSYTNIIQQCKTSYLNHLSVFHDI